MKRMTRVLGSSERPRARPSRSDGQAVAAAVVELGARMGASFLRKALKQPVKAIFYGLIPITAKLLPLN